MCVIKFISQLFTYTIYTLKDMISYLPQLHSFLKSLDGKLHQDDRMRLYEAVAHVISAMPMEQAAQSLQTFIVDIMGKIREIAGRSHVATKQELTDISGQFVVCNYLMKT